jgi:predicted DCC family thiol-disulfide oxidoreductase YuxK
MVVDEKYPVLLFDGVCNLCDGAVRFILKKEKAQELRFAPLQSDHGKTLLKKYGYLADYLEGLVLIENEKAYDRSCACLRVALKLRFPWSLFFPLLAVPKPIRDLIYKLIASQRYRLFGTKDTCLIPTGEDIARFL